MKGRPFLGYRDNLTVVINVQYPAFPRYYIILLFDIKEGFFRDLVETGADNSFRSVS